MVEGKGESLTLHPSGCMTGKSPVTDEARAETPKTKRNEEMKMTNEMTAINNILAGRMMSKVEGRKNYVVYINKHFKTAFVGGIGAMKNRGFTGAYLSDIRTFGLSWSYFTYKKDALELVKALEEEGYCVSRV